MKVVIADSNDIVRAGIHAVLSDDPTIEVVGEARSNEELKKQVRYHQPDVVVMDYTAPKLSIDVVPNVLQNHENLRIVAITPEENPTIILEALKSGVTSYVRKDCDLQEILDSVKRTYEGSQFFCGKIMDIIRRNSIDLEHLETKDFSCGPVTLSKREGEIIKYIAEGSTNSEIADLLHLSQHTVNTHRKNIMGKLGINNTAGLVMYAVKSNIVHPNKFLFRGEE